MPSQAASRRSSSHQTATSMAQNGGDEPSPAPTSLLDDPKYAIASNFLTTMLHEVVIDAALLAHGRVTRQRKAEGRAKGGCPVCRTSCQMLHDGSQKRNEGDETAIKVEAMEEGEASSASQTQESGSAPPKGLEMYQNNPLLACLVCSRQVSANRYAQHLASCVGVGKGGIARRKGKNGAIAGGSAKDRMKIKTALENRKKANFQTQSNRNTPTPQSRPEQDGISDDESSRKSKSLADSLGLNGNGKRPLSPTGGHLKKAKPNTPTRGDSLAAGNSSQPFAPSALGSSLPVTGSPLNPHRNSKPVTALDDEDHEEADDADDDDDDEDEEDEDEDEDEEEEDDDDDDDDDDDGSVALAHEPASRRARAGSVADSFEEDDSASDHSRSEAGSESVSLLSARLPKHKRANPQSAGPGAIERSRGSDGEYIDVESASAHSEVDDDF